MEWSELFRILEQLSSKETEELVLVSPYISTGTLRDLSSSIKAKSVKILTSWNESNLIQGSSSLDLFPLCANNGWELRILNSLHAKIYATPTDEMWVGSANLTASGLGTSSKPNEEVLTKVSANESDWIYLNSLLSMGRLVDHTLHQAYTEWIEEQPKFTNPEIKPFTPPLTNEPMKLDNLPRTFTPIELHQTLANQSSATDEQLSDAQHDLSALRVSFTKDREEFLNQLRMRFFSSPLVCLLIEKIGEEWMRFGEMRINLREACGGVDAVSRDEVTMYTQNLYEWIEDLDDSGEFEFGIPRHSQLIRRIQ